MLIWCLGPGSNYWVEDLAISGFLILSASVNTNNDTSKVWVDPQKRWGEGGVIRLYLLATLFFRWNCGTVEQNHCSPRLARVSAVPPFWRFCSTLKFVEQRPRTKNPARGRVGGGSWLAQSLDGGAHGQQRQGDAPHLRGHDDLWRVAGSHDDQPARRLANIGQDLLHCQEGFQPVRRWPGWQLGCQLLEEFGIQPRPEFQPITST